MKPVLFFSVFLLLSLTAGSVTAQESLGDAARRLRAEKQNSGDLGPDAVSPAVPQIEPATLPLSKGRLLAWAIGGVSDRDLAQEVLARGIDFEVDEEYLAVLSQVGNYTALAGELRKLQRHPSGSGGEGRVADLLIVERAVKSANYHDALKAITSELQSDPHNPDLYFVLGVVLERLEEWDNAGRAFARAIELSPNFAYAHGRLSYMFYKADDGEQAAAQAQLMVNALPESSDAHKWLGLAFSAEGDGEGALREYGKALKFDPKNAAVYYDIGVLRAADEQWEAAITPYEQALKLDSSHWYFYNNFGIALGHTGRIDAAVNAFEKGLALAPERPELLQSYGAMLCNAGRSAKAIEIFQVLLATTPDWNMARPCLYKALMSAGRTAEAQQVKEDYARYSADHSTW